MKKVALNGIKQFEIIDVPRPVLHNDDDVLLKVDTVGVCGSDIHYYNEGRIGDQVIDFPFTIGHECSAVVVETGRNVKDLKPGDLVAVEPALSCHKCSQCLSGREHTCLNQKFLGCPGQTDGCLAEYIVMPARNCFTVPESINSEMAALVEPLSIGYYASRFLKDYKPASSKDADINIAVLGAGPIGLGTMLSLQTAGYKNIYITDLLDYRLSRAKIAGAVWAGNPHKEDIVKTLNKINPGNFDVVFECCGKQEALDQAVDILKPGGLLLIVGIPETDKVSFDISKIRRKEITIQNVRRQNNSVQPVIDLTSAGKWSPEFMITHRFSLEETARAFDIVANYKDEVIKALIKF
ncbi:MAG: alcohol dehydrogenase catalytic domain-containing protein [Ignavibacteriaceae bacterium]